MMLEGQLVTQEVFDMMIQDEMQKLSVDGDKMWVSVMKNFFKNLDYYVDLVISGENKNIFAQVGNAQAILQALNDPTLLQDPGKKAIFFRILSNLGMHTSELQDVENKMQETPMQPAQAQPMQIPGAQLPVATQ
jgi:hypothetical protein